MADPGDVSWNAAEVARIVCVNELRVRASVDHMVVLTDGSLAVHAPDDPLFFTDIQSVYKVVPPPLHSAAALAAAGASSSRQPPLVAAKAHMQVLLSTPWSVKYMSALPDGGVAIAVAKTVYTRGGHVVNTRTLVIPPSGSSGAAGTPWDAYPLADLASGFTQQSDARMIDTNDNTSLCVVLPDARIITAPAASADAVVAAVAPMVAARVWNPVAPAAGEEAAAPDAAKTQPRLLALLEGHERYVSAAAVLPGDRLVTLDGNNVVRLWSLRPDAPYAPLARWRATRDRVILRPLVALHGDMIATGGDRLQVWNVVTGECALSLPLENDRAYVLALQPLPDGWLAGGLNTGHICIWDVASATCVATWPAHARQVQCLALLPDGRLVSGGTDAMVRMWVGPWSLPASRHAAWDRRMPAVTTWGKYVHPVL